MNDNENSAQSQYQLTQICAIAAALLLGIFWMKHGHRLVALWHLYRTRIFILAIVLGLWAIAMLALKIWEKHVERESNRAITKADKRAVYLGTNEEGQKIYLREEFRTGHAQVIGTTNAGKTESVILPWLIKDIENGSGALIIDGKSDRGFLDKLYAYAVKHHRESDFRLFSLAEPNFSSTFNPLAGGSPQEVAERVFSSFGFENEHYRNVQSTIFLQIISLIQERNHVPTFKLIHRLLTDMEELKRWLDECKEKDVERHLRRYHKLEPAERERKISGLDAKLSQFSTGQLSSLFNSERPQLDLGQALRDNLICYFQLPTMYYIELSKATGRLALQCFQSEVAKRHLGFSKSPGFFSCYLDDFQDYIYEGFASLLNKSRSANIGVVFSHQALGDLRKVSDAFANIVATNTNIKVVMRSNDPETCDSLAKTFGTRTSEKVTERRVKGVLGEQDTGEGSVREVEEYRYHPNLIRSLERGQGVVAIPHPKGVTLNLVRFKRHEDLPVIPLPEIQIARSPTPLVPKSPQSESRPDGTTLAGQKPERSKEGNSNEKTNGTPANSPVPVV